MMLFTDLISSIPELELINFSDKLLLLVCWTKAIVLITIYHFKVNSRFYSVLYFFLKVFTLINSVSHPYLSSFFNSIDFGDLV